MKRKGQGRKINIMTLLAIIAAAAAAFWALPLISPFLLKAASISAALSMPEGVVRQIAEQLKP
ncbi:MAG: hypothetical protein IJF25_01470, partial [Oscillospiraceae bacterium]|nr:hypothetical protein [Oscillospiraceae bacterium]